MHVRTIAAGAAALILDQSGADAGVAAPVRRLRFALSPDIRSHVDTWAAEGPDGEQLLCLTDLLYRRALEDEAFRRRMTQAAGPPAAVPALRALAARCRERGHRGAAAWCEDRIAEMTRAARVVDLRPVEVTPAAEHAARHVTTWLAELQSGHASGSTAHTGVLDPDVALDLVSAVLHGSEHGEDAVAAWEFAAGTLIDESPAGLGDRFLVISPDNARTNQGPAWTALRSSIR